MLDFNILRSAAVQITRKGQPTASGWIVPSEKSEVFYCLTARHCVKEPGFSLFLETKDGSKTELRYTNVLMASENSADAAVLCIDYPADQYPEQLFIGKLNREHKQATLIGYPSIRDGNPLCCQVGINYSDLSPEKTIHVNLLNSSTGKASLQDQIIGISGGGCIVEDSSNEYKLVAIETGLADSCDSFGELTCVDLDVFRNLLRDNHLAPLAGPRYRYASRQWGRGINVLQKQMEYRNYEKWVDTAVSGAVIQSIHGYFQNSERTDRPMLLCGSSGVGKTRAVLQACVERTELSNAIFLTAFRNLIRY